MIYSDAQAWRDAPSKRVVLFAMSGLGKTHVSNMLRASGDWFHYSIDYRIGTRYMGEFISDNAKREAMKVPFLRDLLMSDSIDISSNITFDNLTSVAAYLGKPGNPDLGGLAMDEYRQRQAQFARAETEALLDTEYFIDRAQSLYGYPHFVCDTGGSICEWVNADDSADPVLSALSKDSLMVWIKGSDEHTQELIRRFDKSPKPMAYDADFLTSVWDNYLSENNLNEADVDPNQFIRATYAAALAHRQPRYQNMAEHWGIVVAASDMAQVTTPADFEDVIADALETKANNT